ncbi:beta-L-arabinofuranosidase domain-containing protein [Candidatus Sumerlaeota bacterium]
MNNTHKLFTLLLVALCTICSLYEASANDYYNSSRAPLIDTPFVRLPLGSVKADGWLEQQLILQKNGLTGHAEELYGDIGDSAWIGGSNDSWERGPYYAKGLIPLAYILNDAGLITKAQKWIDVVIASQRPDGDFGPRNRNWWPNMIVLYYMRDYYEATNDARIIPFMNKYFQFQLSELSSNSLGTESGWAKARGGDNIDTVFWLYNHNGDSDLLTLADLLDAQTNDWASYYSNGTGDNWYPDHIVNVNQGLKRPPLWYLRSGSAADRDAFINATSADGWLMKAYGRIDDMYNGTEPLTDLSSTEGTELCAIVERILSNSIALRILGNPVIGDQMETVAYNALPGDLKYDIKGLRYYSLMNQPKNTNEDLGFRHNGNGQNAISPSPHSGYGCCRSNFHHGWPKFVQHMWMATSDNGLAVAAYGPSRVTATVGSGVQVTIAQVTDYPFRDTIAMNIATTTSVSFPLKLRIPGWCESPVVEVNSAPQSGVTSGSYYTIDRLWSNGDSVNMTFPMKVRASVWINNSIGLERGPLVYSLLINESWTETSSYLGGQFKTEEIMPTSPWNYGLNIADLDNPDADISVVESAMPTQPFKASDAPVKLILDAKKVLSWGEYRIDLPGRATEPPLSPLVSGEPIEQVTLVPFGSTEIRTTYFPYVGTDEFSEFKFPITAHAGYGGSISPCGEMIVPVGGTQAFTISAIAGSTIKSVTVDGTNIGAVSNYTFENLTASAHTITVSFNVPVGDGSIPRTGELLLACEAKSLPGSGIIDAWPTLVPAGDAVTRMESPTIAMIDGSKFVDILHADGDGFLFKSYASPIACTGASAIVVAKPIRDDISVGWTSVIDVFYDRLVLGVMPNTGKVIVRRNGSLTSSNTAIPDGQTTILSMIVQSNGAYKVYANGIEIMSESGTSDMTSLAINVAGPYANCINIGRNNPDGWSTFNGNIGDVFLYKTALSDPERQELEAYIAAQLLDDSPPVAVTFAFIQIY